METVQLRRFIYEKDSSPGSLCALYACRGCGRQRCEGIQLHALQDSETLKIAEIDTGLTFQFLAHTFERPHRLWCLHLSNCEEVQYTTEGILYRCGWTFLLTRLLVGFLIKILW
jgi:hypothetical protein